MGSCHVTDFPSSLLFPFGFLMMYSKPYALSNIIGFWHSIICVPIEL